MATLMLAKPANRTIPSSLLNTSVPAPFPRELLQRQQTREFTSQEVQLRSESQAAAPSLVSEPDNIRSSTIHGVLHELTPSIANVQKSCLMTLNDLLSAPTKWNPIVPDRRHSMPASRQTPPLQTESDSSSALQILVSNLRNREPTDNMIEFHEPSSDSELFHELRTRVEGISPSLEPADAILANALVSLLSHFSRLSVMQATSSQPATPSRPSTSRETHNPNSASTADLFHDLKRQLGDLQIERLSSQHILPPGAPPVLAVEAALLWNRIDEELETVVAMCKERTETRSLMDILPPQYDPADYQQETPPDYELGDGVSIEDTKSRYSPVTPSRHLDEKMRLDLEGVAMAIDRLYMVAPQLHNQRVELKSSKLAQMERASREGMSSRRSGKEKEADIHELDDIFEMLGKASERSLSNQKVVLEEGLTGRLEKARLRDIAKKEAFVEQLAKHSDAGRFHSQDAVLQPRTKDPRAMLTLPEFIREPMPRPEDAQAMLALPEDQPPPHTDTIRPTSASGKVKKNLRNRSLSAPSLSWLRSTSRSGSNTPNTGLNPSRSRPRSRGQNMVPNMDFDVHYVAENHENLQHVLVFLTLTDTAPGVDVEAEVLSLSPDDATEGTNYLVIRSGSNTSLPLALPAHTPLGKPEIKQQGGHYEIKLMSVSSSTSAKEDPPPFLDATQLASANPTSFICASCSLPLVQSTKIKEYRDLPSEHWQELVDAWMCHSDQKIHEEVVNNSRRGFWPEPRQALVGGSYLLFEESSVTRNNLHLADERRRGEDWRLARCLCGAVIGRCQKHQSLDGSISTVYRLLKYAIRPVSPMNELAKTPLSAFIVEDMMEFVQAHATYRFVILDEEEELPRILIWLFKPNLRLAYAMPSLYALPKSGSIHVAKVLYKVLTPSERTVDLKTILDKYPGFPQAEYLHYPMPICRRIAGLLRESNSTYPESMRFMTGLQVGWLHRA